MIFCVERLHDFLWRGCRIFFVERLRFVEMLRDYLSEEVA